MAMLKRKYMEANNAGFLFDASLLYQETCPELSRFLMQKPYRLNRGAFHGNRPAPPNGVRSLSLFHDASVCRHCFQWFRPGNHRVRLRPKRRPTARVQRVLCREARGRRLSLTQRQLLHRFRKSCSFLMATCHTCNKTSRYSGMNREFILSKTRSVPGSTGKHKTPQAASKTTSTPKSVSKEKTPSSTPRSTPASTPGSYSSSSQPSKVKRWIIQRLSKLLLREESTSSKKGSLKDFLSSL